jgi:tRNA threonylcarbamoyladenosine biosynthesis protein TsaB
VAGAEVTLLAIETATDLVGAALLRDDGGLSERSHEGGRSHAELLAPAIEEVCAVSGCVLADLDALAVDVGPGLFTGLRVGVATAKALGQALGLGVIGISSLDILASAAVGLARPDRARWVVAVVDARRGEVFAAAYAVGDADSGDPADPAPARIDPGEPLRPEALTELLGALVTEGPVVVVGDGAVRYGALLGTCPGVDLGFAGRIASPPPTDLARLASRRLSAGFEPLAPADLVPDYRRHADARINWEVRAPRRDGVRAGGDPC